MPLPEEPVQFQIAEYGKGIARSTDGGVTWETLSVFREPPAKWWAELRDIALSPTFAQDATVYALGGDALYRSTDGGTTWQRLQDERIGERDSGTYLRVLAVSPDHDGTHDLFLGSEDGDFLAVQPGKARWEETGALVPPAPTAAPTLAPAATLTPAATPASTPTPCPLAPAAPFASAYSQAAGQLGCPLADASQLFLAKQPFERGLMFWREDLRLIYVLYADGSWSRYMDTYREDQPSYDETIVPPAGLYQPVRGFGRVWREEEGVREGLGWATAGEQGGTGLLQAFQGGLMLLDPQGRAYVLYAESDEGGRWQ